MRKNVLAVFARFPEPGKVKTRIASRLGNEAACAIYERILRRQLAEHRQGSYDCVAFVSPSEKVDAFVRLYRMRAFPQRGEDLGSRLDDAFHRLLFEYEAVAVAGSDIPGLSRHRVEEAFAATANSDVVLGPCPDGGYYLIASRKNPDAFTNIPWSTSEVLARTLERIKASGRSSHLLPEEADVDNVEDLPLLSPRLSLIIPVTGFDEPDSSVYRTFDECILVDGGAGEGIAERARSQGATVLSSPKGRAIQMNLGAKAARGNILLFLHADTRLPMNAEELVLHAIDRGAIGGCFETVFDGSHPLYRLGDFWRNLRARWLGEFYGDQSIFIRRDVFFRLGGYRELRVMEDYDLCLRMRRSGRLAYIPARAVTSARRFATEGIVGTWIRDQRTKVRFSIHNRT
jgi:rSAM/selenodomain-associated transferase 2/rSAM/selenodomain-associated transferase 1